jgi:hydroxymethylglutaryl-CoA reductase (NADPH)
MKHDVTYTSVPTQWIEAIHFHSMKYLHFQELDVNLSAPLATYETTLFHSVRRGAKAVSMADNLSTTVLSDSMTRSLLFEARNTMEAQQVCKTVESKIHDFQEDIVGKMSKYAKLSKIETKIVGKLLYIRLSFETGEASGHNMTTFASDAIADSIVIQFPFLNYISVSGNYCVDKKVSAVNSILGRGKYVVAEVRLSRKILHDLLKTTPEKMVALNLKKNLIGSIISGSLMSANAHYANMLLAFYIATGQDGANIVEGSQGITYCGIEDDQLYFSVTLPNIIIGTVGHGKDNLDAKRNLERMECTKDNGAQKCAQIAAALVLCGELSLMAALTNKNELTKSHQSIERVKI